jgi:hypothetical protein
MSPRYTRSATTRARTRSGARRSRASAGTGKRTDIALNKIAALERCLARVAEEYRGDPARLEHPATQDSVVPNLQRVCGSAIDLAMHIVAVKRLGDFSAFAAAVLRI